VSPVTWYRISESLLGGTTPLVTRAPRVVAARRATGEEASSEASVVLLLLLPSCWTHRARVRAVAPTGPEPGRQMTCATFCSSMTP